MINRSATRAYVLFFFLSCAGCSGIASNTDAAVALEDAGLAGDADAGSDAGAATDAGEAGPADAGSTTDAGVTGDAGLVTAAFTTSTATFPNPERGWYVWASGDFGASIDTGSLNAAYANGVRLAFTVIDLSAFRSTPISTTFLDALSARFVTLRSRGFKAVVRFAYDYTAGGNDAPATQIASHLQQLAPLLAANADAIAFFQAGFIGAWGEWHSSKNSNSYGYMTNAGVTQAQADANRLIVRDALLAAVPPGIPLGFRYPGDLIKWYPNPSQQARVGLHNDCWLAGPSDTGTYQSQAQRTYIAALSAQTAFGGETCEAGTPLRTSCSDVRTEGAQYHLAYLNQGYFAGFITAWTSGGCLDEVGRTMGYRFQLDGVRHAASATRGSTVRFAVELRNVGWARLFSPRPLVVTLQRGNETITGASSASLATLDGQAVGSSTLDVDVAIPANSTPGTWAVSLSVPDVFATTASDARFSIRFANADSGAQQWDATTARFVTGTTLTIDER